MAEVLTPREHDVALLITKGCSNKQIAVKLDISEHTAKFHVMNVIHKLDCLTRVDAAVKYVRWLDIASKVKEPAIA